jgi:hypothetical protein
VFFSRVQLLEFVPSTCGFKKEFTQDDAALPHQRNIHNLLCKTTVLWNNEERRVIHSEASLAMKEPVMMGFLTVSTIAGMILGLYFRVYVLVPTLFLEAAAITIFGFFAGAEFEAVLLTVVAAISSLQFGYFGGCLAAAQRGPITSQTARR